MPSNTRLPISVIILTLNEEQGIQRCLEGVQSWAGEIILVDSGSSDATVALAKHYTDQIYVHPFENYAKQRNWSQNTLPLAHEWVFHLDANEVVSAELAAAMRRAFQHDPVGIDGFLINRRTIFLGKWIKHGGLYPTYHLRLFRKSKGFCEDREYDQHFVVHGRVQELQGDILDHIAHELSQWTLSHERWSTAEVQEHFKRASAEPGDSPDNRVQPNLFGTAIERRRWLRNKLFGRSPLFFRAFLYFFIRYFLRLGFLDGKAGLIYHVLHGFWYRFYIDAKIWEMQNSSS